MIALLLACTDAVVDDTGEGVSRGDFAMTAGPIQACERTAEVPTWTEVGEAWGLAGSPRIDGPHGEGGSLAVLDVDADGDLDVVVGFTDDVPQLYRRDGEGFDREAFPGGYGPWMATTADVDSDGRLDLLFGGETPSVWLGDGTGFTEGTLPPLPAHTDLEGTVVKELSAGDLDGDGAADLYAVVNSGQADAEDSARADFLLLGDGAGGFVVDSDHLDPSATGRSGFDATWLDWQRDGDLDVYVVEDMGHLHGPDVLWRNDGGALSLEGGCGCDVTVSGMGLDVGDLNGDGRPDLYIAATGGNVLLESQPDDTYVDTTETRGVGVLEEAWRMPWGALILDHDNDGHRDLWVARGDMWFSPDDESMPIEDLTLVMLAGDGVSFEDVSASRGLDAPGSWRSLVATDHNGDGVLDLLASQVTERPSLWLSDGCTAPGWLAVEAPLHARVEVETSAGVQTAWVTTESAYGAARPPEAWFGLGAHQQVDRVTVTLLDGRSAWFEDLGARRRISASPD